MTHQVGRQLTCVLVAILCTFSEARAQSVPQVATSFALKDGDRVLFYGDSITEQRGYTEDVEEYVLTRFPQWKVTFFNAGVGGDKVSGGAAGPVDLRLQRDVFPQHPDVITVMLGMNDGFSRPEELGIFSTYSDGYRHIVESMQTALPQAQITLIQPSPYDDITREPRFPGGYNSVMLRYGNFVAELSRERKTQLADFNSPVTTLLKTLNQQAPDLARQLLPDRVHPGQGGHWVMAESLLKAWHAPPLISSVAVDVGSKVPTTEVHNAKITELRKFKGGLIWTQVDDALPLPLPPVEVDPVCALTMEYSDLVQSLDQQTLRVRGLANGSYDLLIDARKVGTFLKGQLAAGINLATLDTAMLEQARLVAYDTERKNSLEAARFQIIRVSAEEESSKTARTLAAAILEAGVRQWADARPRPHQFQLVVAPRATP